MLGLGAGDSWLEVFADLWASDVWIETLGGRGCKHLGQHGHYVAPNLQGKAVIAKDS